MTGKRKIWMVIGIVLAVLLIGAAVVWVIKRNKKDLPTMDKPKPKPIVLSQQATEGTEVLNQRTS